MKINFNKSNGILSVAIEGRLDTTTAPELDLFLRENYNGIGEIVIDCEKLEYVSSAGLRAFKRLFMELRRKGGTLSAKNINKSIMEVLEVTGFTRLFKFV
jgi:anti-sigma B factor antagonist